MRIALLIPLALAAAAAGQTPPSTRPATTSRPATATRPASSPPKNVDRALQDLISLDADARPLGEVTDLLHDLTQTNLVVNWNALGQAGVKRDAPISLRVKDAPCEQVLRTLMELVPAAGTRANYAVGENALQITTNQELGIGEASHIYPLARAISYSFNAQVTRAEQEQNTALVEAVLRAELRRAGEPLDIKGHTLGIKDGVLAATISPRGQEVLNKAVIMFNQPLKVGSLAGGTQLTGPAKRTQDAYKAFQASPAAATPEAMARDWRKFAQFNLGLLPGTAEELAQPKPDIGAVVNDGGVLLFGPRAAIKARTALAMYDLSEVIRKLAAKNKITPPPKAADYQQAIVQVLQTTIKPEGDAWGGQEDLGKMPAVMIPYNGMLIVFATAETHRTVAGALQDMNK